NDINSLLAGDLLLEVLPDIATEWRVDFHNGIRLGDTPTAAGKTVHIGFSADWSFDHYPVSTHLKEELAHPEIRAELDIVRLDAAKRYGQLLHELMAETTSQADLEIRLNALQAQGLLR